MCCVLLVMFCAHATRFSTVATMDSKAEKLAAEYEQGEIDPTKNNGGKRTKSEQVDHKHTHPEGDTRKMVQMAMNGEQKRREHTK
ncbi:hypothetical protein QR680_012656 [Steinernema hermaphroditum]|uniref:Secreted protein n=1 Tax=Steinernema hermaphroditum TaxID=289476 RepID=A0AA39I517_9BILA|nr:hypothetical protein QR680_012656 [Steinernema hermaphroditum]